MLMTTFLGTGGAMRSSVFPECHACWLPTEICSGKFLSFTLLSICYPGVLLPFPYVFLLQICLLKAMIASIFLV